jgi:uncharacterized repeat protein (TIGR03943 family)
MLLQRLERQLVFLAPAIVMSAWATVMLHTLLVGHINRLLNPMFRSYVGIAAVVLLVLSALHLLLYRPSPERAPGVGRQLGRWLVLLVPVIAACVLSPAALSDNTARLRSSGPAGVAAMPSMANASARDVKDAADTDPSQPAPMEVTDLVTISHTPELIKKFDGRQVHVIGLYAAGGTPKLMRWIMWCCAADAAPASVSMTGQLGGPWKDQEWLDVTGVARFPATMGQVIPQIEVTSAKQTPEPDEPFLSP